MYDKKLVNKYILKIGVIVLAHLLIYSVLLAVFPYEISSEAANTVQVKEYRQRIVFGFAIIVFLPNTLSWLYVFFALLLDVIRKKCDQKVILECRVHDSLFLVNDLLSFIKLYSIEDHSPGKKVIYSLLPFGRRYIALPHLVGSKETINKYNMGKTRIQIVYTKYAHVAISVEAVKKRG